MQFFSTQNFITLSKKDIFLGICILDYFLKTDNDKRWLE